MAGWLISGLPVYSACWQGADWLFLERLIDITFKLTPPPLGRAIRIDAHSKVSAAVLQHSPAPDYPVNINTYSDMSNIYILNTMCIIYIWSHVQKIFVKKR